MLEEWCGEALTVTLPSPERTLEAGRRKYRRYGIGDGVWEICRRIIPVIFYGRSASKSDGIIITAIAMIFIENNATERA